jgi:hypothetical protein
MKTTKLTTGELVFLRENNLSVADIFQGDQASRKHSIEQAKRQNKRFFLGAPCKKAGHRIRTTSGHCIHCNPAAIAHHIRHRSEGYVYLAYSESAGLAKIGMTEKRSSGNEISNRQKTLRNGTYAGLTDWKIIMYFFSSEAGKQEDDLSGSFRTKKVFSRYYEKDGRDQEATEIYRMPRDKATSTFVRFTHKNKLTLLEFPNASASSARTLTGNREQTNAESERLSKTNRIVCFLYDRFVSFFRCSGR